ncbi:hypothetical protein NW761_008557 [Fusarium oxysporum]|nr:hypothetical protein NW758_006448 [Fusarium oxysporum]KAJ4086935.1 hypothetical protein NW761_008557 [Fusarium oxysporum]
MDPLSLIASIAGIATAGTSLSKAIYHFISSTRGASREMVEIARNISDLSCILYELRRVLQDSADLCSHKLLRRIKSAMRRISAIHDGIYALMDSSKGFQTFRWSLKRSEVQYKLTLIESHKTAIHLMLNILILAAATRKEAQCRASQTTSTTESKQKEPESEVPLLRQQSENIAYAACHCLVDLSESQQFETTRPSKQPKTDSGSENHAIGQIRNHGSSDGTPRWLFELVFESYSKTSQGSRAHDQNIGKEHEVPISDRTAIVFRAPSELQTAIYESGAGEVLVDTLLADWTSLSKEEITGKPVSMPGTEPVKPSVSDNPQKDVPGIHFKDAIGRKFTFPYHVVQTWEGMKQLIRQHVVAGCHPGLIGPNGDLIQPSQWEKIVEPGMHVEMTLRPTPDSRKPEQNVERKKNWKKVQRKTKNNSFRVFIHSLGKD